MKQRPWRRVLAFVALTLTLTVAAAPIARGQEEDEETVPAQDGPWLVGTAAAGGMIVDDYLKDATPEDAAEGLTWCEAVPGCVAIWQEGVGTTVLLVRVPAEGSGGDPSDALGDY